MPSRANLNESRNTCDLQSANHDESQETKPHKTKPPTFTARLYRNCLNDIYGVNLHMLVFQPLSIKKNKVGNAIHLRTIFQRAETSLEGSEVLFDMFVCLLVGWCCLNSLSLNFH